METLKDHTISATDPGNPHSLVNYLPERTRQKILDRASESPELFVIDETGLKTALRERGFNPTATDNCLRLKLWMCFERAISENAKRIVVSHFLTGICSDVFFEQKYLMSTNRVAWLMCMPLNYQLKMEETLAYSAGQLRDILEMDHIDPVSKKPNLQLMNLKAKIHMMIDMRLNGAPTQRLEQKSLSINVNRTDAKEIHGLIESGQERTVNERIKMLENRQRESSHVPKLAEWQTMPVTNVKVSDDKE